MYNVTSEVIAATIDYDYGGDVLEFIADFIDYCNVRTTFGVPRKHSPLEEVRHEYYAVLCTTCDILLDASNGTEPAIVEFEEYSSSEESFTVCATRYYRDNETSELCPECYTPCFTVTRPKELASMCEYIGVNFCSDFFEE